MSYQNPRLRLIAAAHRALQSASPCITPIHSLFIIPAARFSASSNHSVQHRPQNLRSPLRSCPPRRAVLPGRALPDGLYGLAIGVCSLRQPARRVNFTLMGPGTLTWTRCAWCGKSSKRLGATETGTDGGQSTALCLFGHNPPARRRLARRATVPSGAHAPPCTAPGSCVWILLASRHPQPWWA